MKKYPTLAVLAAGLCFLPPAFAADPVPDTLDLSDCRILEGKLYADNHRRALADITEQAQAGSLEDRKTLAAIANNRFACFLETVSDSAGWSVMIEDKDKNAESGVVSTSSRLLDIGTLRRYPDGLKALREAEQGAQAIADQDLAYRNIAARFVADYPAVFQLADHADAYRNAVGVKAVACQDADARETAHAQFCNDARGALASLLQLLPEEKRMELEAAGLAWAKGFLARKPLSRPEK